MVYLAKEENCTFQGSYNHHKALVDSMLTKVTFCAMRCKEFHVHDVDSIMWDFFFSRKIMRDWDSF